MRNHAPPDAGLMKEGRSDHELPLSDRVAAIVERYITVERQELLHCESHDYVWVAQGGGPLSEKGIDFMMRSRTKAQYGVAFRRALLPGRPHHDTGAGRWPEPARHLAHPGPFPGGALKHYNRAGALEASRRHAAYIDAAEDAAASMLGRAPVQKPKPVRSVLSERSTGPAPRSLSIQNRSRSSS
jgi:hypothetical protein